MEIRDQMQIVQQASHPRVRTDTGGAVEDLRIVASADVTLSG